MSNEASKVAPEAYEVSIPNDSRRFRCIKCERAESSNKNLMLKQEFEVFGAKPVRNSVTGQDVDINGLVFYTQQMLMTKSLKYINLQRDSLGLPAITEEQVTSIDPMEYVGREGVALSDSKLEEKKNPVTGEPIINLHTGKPMTQVNRKIGEWCGRN